jgi:hypothetical protein
VPCGFSIVFPPRSRPITTQYRYEYTIGSARLHNLPYLTRTLIWREGQRSPYLVLLYHTRSRTSSGTQGLLRQAERSRASPSQGHNTHSKSTSNTVNQLGHSVLTRKSAAEMSAHKHAKLRGLSPAPPARASVRPSREAGGRGAGGLMVGLTARK